MVPIMALSRMFALLALCCVAFSSNCHAEDLAIKREVFSDASNSLKQLELGLKAQLHNSIEFHVNVVKKWASDSNSSLGTLGINYFF